MNAQNKISLISQSCAALGVMETLTELCPWPYASAARLDIDDRDFDSKFHTDTATRICNEDLEMSDLDAKRSATMYRTSPLGFGATNISIW